MNGAGGRSAILFLKKKIILYSSKKTQHKFLINGEIKQAFIKSNVKQIARSNFKQSILSFMHFSPRMACMYSYM